MTFVLHPRLAMLESLSQQDLAWQVLFLREENRTLRLSKRTVVAQPERSRLLTFGRDIGT